jgi:hypothetical protein
MAPGTRTFICRICSRELPVSKQTERENWSGEMVTVNVCTDCKTRKDGSTKQVDRSEGSDLIEFQSDQGLFDESGDVRPPDSVSQKPDSQEIKANNEDIGSSDVDANNRVETTAPDIIHQKSVEDTLEKGHVHHFGFDIGQPAHFEYVCRVTEGPNADIVVLDEDNLNRWLDGKNAKYYTDKSELDTREASIQAKLPIGKFYLLIDNTRMGKATPPLLDGSANSTLNFELEYVVYR